MYIPKNRQKNSAKYELEEIVRKVLDSAPNRGWVEKYGQIFGSWAQIGILALLLVSYFWTVKPVFQKERLAEEVARLEIERKQLAAQIRSYKNTTDTKISEIKALKAEKIEIEQQLENEVKRRKQVLDETELVEKELEKAKEKLYGQIKQRLTGSAPITSELRYYIANIFSAPRINWEDALPEKLESIFDAPLRIANNNLQEITKKRASFTDKSIKSIYGRLENEYKKGIREHGSLLKCAKPDFPAWKDAFSKAKNAIDSKAKECIDMHWDKRIEEEGWGAFRIKYLKQTKFWEEQSEIFKRICKSTLKYELEFQFTDRWRYVIEPCMERIRNVSAIILGQKHSTSIMPLRDISPPTLQDVEKMFSEANDKLKE